MSFTIFADVNSIRLTAPKDAKFRRIYKRFINFKWREERKREKGLCVCSGRSEAFRIKKEGETLTNSDRLFRYGLVISSHSKIKLYDGKNKIK